ncbi:ABC transporter ATP-binding protein [Terasakiella pusilla]|uniref:ABC transporter ATP-binding protein n=1 Tax=Terasakiella pusilla TaxID=64973 RepID=UPI003AA973D3
MSLISAEQLSVTIDDKQLLEDVSFHVEQGELIGLIGPNGAGKSTLLKTLIGLTEPTSGRVIFKGKPLADLPMAARGRQIGYVAQGSICHWPMTVQKVVEMGRLPYQRLFRQKNAADIAAINAALKTFDITHLKDRLVSTLSGGERARVMLARAHAGTPHILFADEPTADLDPGHQLQVMNVLQTQARAGMACVVVLHDLNLASRFCDRLYLLQNGRLKAAGPVADVLKPTHLKQAYGIEALLGLHQDENYIVPWRLIS